MSVMSDRHFLLLAQDFTAEWAAYVAALQRFAEAAEELNLALENLAQKRDSLAEVVLAETKVAAS